MENKENKEYELDDVALDNHSEITEQIQGMEFKLICELGSIDLTINDLLNLKEDEEININQNLQKIKLKINGVTVGFGELVQIDGKTAVKIVKLLTNLKDL